MIERKTMLDRVELSRDGSVSIRLALMLVENGVELHTQYHRCSIDINGDVVTQMADVVGHLAEQGFPPLPESALGLLRAGHTLIKDYLLATMPAPADDGHMMLEDLRNAAGGDEMAPSA